MVLNQPPLANGLFGFNEEWSGILSSYPYLSGIIGELRAFARMSIPSIEDKFMEIEAQAEEGFAMRHRQLAAIRFYLKDIMAQCSQTWPVRVSGATNYARLLDRLLLWQHRNQQSICFVTFNYDNLLEQAFRRSGLAIDALGSYFGLPNLTLIKAHGSIEWNHRTEPDTALASPTTTSYINHAESISVDPEIFFGAPPLVHGQVAVPAVAIPVARDKRFECPDNHVTALNDALRSATRLLIIGWAGADTHFLQLARKAGCNPQKTLIACDSQEASSSTNARLFQGTGIQNCDPTPFGFSSIFSDEGKRRLDAFLE